MKTEKSNSYLKQSLVLSRYNKDRPKLGKVNTTSHLRINVYSFSHILFISNTMVVFIHLLGRNRKLTVHQCYTTFSVIGYDVKKAKCYLVISSITMFYRMIFPSKIKDRTT